VVSGQVLRDFIRAGSGEDSPTYYLGYLFADVKHTWLLPYLAVAALVWFKPAHRSAA
jgi:hypothetical protein